MNIVKKYYLPGAITFVSLLLIGVIALKQRGNVDEASFLEESEMVGTLSIDGADSAKGTGDTPEKDSSNSALYDTGEIEESVVLKEKIVAEVKDFVSYFYESIESLDEFAIDSEDNREALLQMRAGIERYSDISSYVRQGLEKNTYVIFSSYNIKFYNIETKAPGMSVLYLLRNEDYSFTILNGLENEDLSSYIIKLTEEEEIHNLLEKVNQELYEALEADEVLKNFVQELQNAS